MGTHVLRIKRDEPPLRPERRGKREEVALLDDRFYVLAVLRQGEATSGRAKTPGYLLEAERLGAGVIGKGDRLALVWGW